MPLIPELTADGRWLLPTAGPAARLLQDLGLNAGDRVGFAVAPGPVAAGILQAALELGIALVLFNRRLTPGECAALHARSRVRTVLISGDHPLGNLGVTHVIVPDRLPAGPIPDRVTGDELPALILFTSGTTGQPKAASLSRRAVWAAARSSSQRLALSPMDTWLGCMPLDHAGGAMVIHRQTIAGNRVRLLPRFDVAQVQAYIDAGDCTGLSVVPTMLHRLIAHRAGRPWPTSLRIILSGGGPLAEPLARASLDLGLAPVQTYGLTECAGQVCTLAPEAAATGLGTCGPAVPGMAVRIRAGQVEVRGDGLFSGYEDAAGVPRLPLTEDGWFATGDLGDLDQRGFLRLFCRRSDLIVSGGENVYPAEVEGVLEAHPRVVEALVHGEPDAEWGQVVCATVATRDGLPLGSADQEAAVAGLAGYKKPRRWRFVAALDRTSSGKVIRPTNGFTPNT